MFPLPEWVQATLAILILLGAGYSFIRELVPPDITALFALLALLLTGILSPGEAFSGFSHPATVSVAAVLVLSAGLERTGVLRFLARRVLAPLGRSEFLLTFALMVVVGGISAFINNTAAVAVFIPVVLDVCRRAGKSPGRVLMPMSHAATMGGMCTLIGTSTNLAAHEYARSQGLPGFGMFELGRVALPMVGAGFAYILLVGRWFLPRRRDAAALPEPTGRYLAALVVPGESPWIGREVRASALHRDFDLELVEMLRGDEPVALDPTPRYQAGDRVRVRGALEGILRLAAHRGLTIFRPAGWREEDQDVEGGEAPPSEAGAPAPPVAAPDAHGAETADAAPAAGVAATKPEAGSRPAARPKNDARAEEEPAMLPLAEFVVLPGSNLIGRTLHTMHFAERFNAVVLALHRPGESLAERPETIPIRAGDVLVIEGSVNVLQALADRPGLLMVASREHPEERSGKMGIAFFTLVGVVLLVSFGVLPIVTAATAGCAVLIVTGCLKPGEAYRAIDLSIVFLLAGALALGMALEKTGVTQGLATLLANMTGFTGPFAVLVGFFVVSVVLSELMSNAGTVLLLGPVAVSTAAQMGINPMALLAAITFGASAAFAVPIGYQTSVMIYAPGGYRFRDYVRMGAPLDILLAAFALWLIPRYWPLTPP